jgi:ribosomal protein S18 acetylase RimI-like enzyme
MLGEETTGKKNGPAESRPHSFRRSSSYRDGTKVESLNALIDKVFGFDFRDWRAAGFWDESYRPYTLFDGDRAVSNVSVYSLDMRIGSEWRKAAQICTTATLPDYRHRGLATDLLDAALKEARASHDFVFLLAADDALGLYRRQGFRPVIEHMVRYKPPRTRPREGLRRLDAESADDLALIACLAGTRAPVSELCGVRNTSLLMFHCLYDLRDCLAHIPDLDCVVLYERKGRRLRIYDVIAREVPPFAALHPYLTAGGREDVAFCFLPDRMQIRDPIWRRSRENNLHVLGPSPFVGRRVMLPFTCHA